MEIENAIVFWNRKGEPLIAIVGHEITSEKLIEVLLSEKALNTILVSHGFSHPLLEKTFVTKTNNISRIES